MYDNKKFVSFADVQELKEFVDVASQCDFEIDAYYNRVAVDAKSILGMLAIGMKKRIAICYGGSNARLENLIAKFATA